MNETTLLKEGHKYKCFLLNGFNYTLTFEAEDEEYIKGTDEKTGLSFFLPKKQISTIREVGE